jgi:hypothetical protein
MQVLFRTIPKEEEEALRLRYAGSQAERSSANAKDRKASDKGAQGLLHLLCLCTAGRRSSFCLHDDSCNPPGNRYGQDVAGA